MPQVSDSLQRVAQDVRIYGGDCTKAHAHKRCYVNKYWYVHTPV